MAEDLKGGEGGVVEKAAPKRRKLSDVEVAAFLADFRDRPGSEQQASVVWQELAAFPQWANAQYRDGTTPLAPPPDPRLPPMERRAAVAAQAAAQGTAAGSPTRVAQGPDGARSIRTADGPGKPANPWSDFREPEGLGPAFVGCNTDQRPPWSGDWQRRQGGWYREKKG